MSEPETSTEYRLQNDPYILAVKGQSERHVRALADVCPVFEDEEETQPC